MPGDPPKFRVELPVEPRQGNPMTDAEGFVVLSERDIERIARHVAKALAIGPHPVDNEPLVPVRRNAPTRPMSEY